MAAKRETKKCLGRAGGARKKEERVWGGGTPRTNPEGELFGDEKQHGATVA